MGATMYYDKDADLNLFKGKKIAVIGYGSQGHAQAQNLKDSGLDVIVAQRPGSDNHKRAVAAGFKPVSAAEAAKAADFIQMLVPDEAAAKIWSEDIKPNIKKGATLSFSHGFNIRFNQIEPTADINVVMIAPKGPGHLVRSQYTEGKGVPCLVAVQQDATKNAREIALAYAKGIGGTRSGVIETTFAEETETDLFGEQAVLCGGAVELIKAGFQTLVDAGYQPEVAYFECLHELKLITDLIFEGGIANMNYSVSDTAEYGEYVSGPRVVNEESKKEMKNILADIRSGKFAKEWLLENHLGRPMFKNSRREISELKIEVVGKQLRAMMPWLKKTLVKD